MRCNMGFLQYAAKRIGVYFLVLFIGITITFFVPRLMPTNPIDNYISQMQSRAGQTLTPEATRQLRESLEQLYGLKGSIFTQYVDYLKRIVLHFDFGPSLSSYPRPVSEMVFAALPWTVGLLLTTTVLAWLLGNLIGLIAGYFHNNLAASFPSGGLTFAQFGTILYNSALPAMTLVLAGFGWNILSMKSLAYATKEEPYAVFARLKGTSDWTRMTSYVFRNAMLPQITSLVLSVGTIFSGALLTEILFSYPGLGLLMRTAAGSGDYNLLYGTITMSIIAVASAGLILDLIYPLFDPRIRYR